MEIAVNLDGGTRVSAVIKGLRIETDQPRVAGEAGTAPSPFDLFLASLATCSGYYVLDFCGTRGIPTDDIRVFMRIEPHAVKRRIGKISIEIQLPPEFPERYRGPVVRAADLCSVKKHILDPPEFDTYATIEGKRV